MSNYPRRPTQLHPSLQGQYIRSNAVHREEDDQEEQGETPERRSLNEMMTKEGAEKTRSSIYRNLKRDSNGKNAFSQTGGYGAYGEQRYQEKTLTFNGKARVVTRDILEDNSDFDPELHRSRYGTKKKPRDDESMRRNFEREMNVRLGGLTDEYGDPLYEDPLAEGDYRAIPTSETEIDALREDLSQLGKSLGVTIDPNSIWRGDPRTRQRMLEKERQKMRAQKGDVEDEDAIDDTRQGKIVGANSLTSTQPPKKQDGIPKSGGHTLSAGQEAIVAAMRTYVMKDTTAVPWNEPLHYIDKNDLNRVMSHGAIKNAIMFAKGLSNMPAGYTKGYTLKEFSSVLFKKGLFYHETTCVSVKETVPGLCKDAFLIKVCFMTMSAEEMKRSKEEDARRKALAEANGKRAVSIATIPKRQVAVTFNAVMEKAQNDADRLNANRWVNLNAEDKAALLSSAYNETSMANDTLFFRCYFLS